MSASRSASATRLAIITGASSGLGRALAEHLAANGNDLVLVARNRVRLDETANALRQTHSVRVEVIPADLSDPDAPLEVFEYLRRRKLTADVLVNNAGFNVYGRFEDTDLEKELEMIRLHLIATTQLTKFFIRNRDKSRANRILNVSSIAALVPGPFVSVHFATRAHLLNFSLALAEEFRDTDLNVTCVCPGPMKTNFFERAGMTYVRLVSGWPLKMMSPTDVATCACRALLSGRTLVVPGFRNRVFAFAADIAPRSVRTRFAKWIMARI